MDSANPEKFRGALPTVERLTSVRRVVAERVHARIGTIATPIAITGDIYGRVSSDPARDAVAIASVKSRRFAPRTG